MGSIREVHSAAFLCFCFFYSTVIYKQVVAELFLYHYWALLGHMRLALFSLANLKSNMGYLAIMPDLKDMEDIS